MSFSSDVTVIGGCGHVGLPLAIAFADRGLRVTAYDINLEAVEMVNSGKLPFEEPGAIEILQTVLDNKNFQASVDPSSITESEYVVVVIGTPVDEHLNPDPEAVPNAILSFGAHLTNNQVIVLRSTIYPGVTRLVERRVNSIDPSIEVAYCPERIAEGKAFTELFELPQIVSGTSASAVQRAKNLFGRLTNQLIEVEPEEAELAKLFTNTWRYIKFAAANQLFMIANDYGVDFEKVRTAMTTDYPRAADMPGAGFAAGPCLFKDTMQLAAFNNNNFTLGHASMMVNEGLPLYLVARIEERFDLSKMSVGILGMAFKGESDDTRSSLSYKLKRILRFKSERVMCADPFVTTDHDLLPLPIVVEKADLLIIGAPHSTYRNIETDKPVIDIWNLLNNGVLI